MLHEQHGTKSALLEVEMRAFLEAHGLGEYGDQFVSFGIDELAEFKDEVKLEQNMRREEETQSNSAATQQIELCRARKRGGLPNL